MEIAIYSVGSNNTLLLEIGSDSSGETQFYYFTLKTITDENGVIIGIDSVDFLHNAFEYIYKHKEEGKLDKLDDSFTEYLVKLVILKVKEMSALSKSDKNKRDVYEWANWNDTMFKTFLLLIDPDGGKIMHSDSDGFPSKLKFSNNYDENKYFNLK